MYTLTFAATPPLSQNERGRGPAKRDRRGCPGRSGGASPATDPAFTMLYNIQGDATERSDFRRGCPGSDRECAAPSFQFLHILVHTSNNIPEQFSHRLLLIAISVLFLTSEPVQIVAALTSADPPEPTSHRKKRRDRESHNKQERHLPRLPRTSRPCDGTRRSRLAPKRSVATLRTRSRVR